MMVLSFFMALPVTVGFAYHDAALGQKSLEDSLNLELGIFGFPHAQGSVLEIAKERHVLNFGSSRHSFTTLCGG